MDRKECLFSLQEALMGQWINKRENIRTLQRSIRDYIGTMLGELIQNSATVPEISSRTICNICPAKKKKNVTYVTSTERHSVWITAPRFVQSANIEYRKNVFTLKICLIYFNLITFFSLSCNKSMKR